MAALGVRPPIVRQWRPCVWVIVRRKTTRADNLADHDGVVASIVHALGCALQPGQGAIDEGRPAERAGGVRDEIELAKQVSSAVGEVPSQRLLVDGQQ